MSSGLASKLSAVGCPRILVVGDLILDRYHHGRVDRISPEAPVPVFVHDRTEDRLGGAGAVAAMASALGGDVTLMAAAGPYGIDRAPLESLLDAASIMPCIGAQPRTTIKTRYIVNGKHFGLRHDQDGGGGAAEWSYPPNLKQFDIILVADYGRGVVTPSLMRELVASSVPVIVDPHRHADWSDYEGCVAIKCNEAESNDAEKAGRCGDNLSFIQITTLGIKGIDLHVPQGHYWHSPHFPAKPRRVVDVCGAGDMVLAALGVCIAGGMDWREACEVANAAAGLKVERFGAAPVTRAEVVADLGGVADSKELSEISSGKNFLTGGWQNAASNPLLNHFAHPVGRTLIDFLPLQNIRAFIEQQRAVRKRIVFANGCFDVLHAGHVRFLLEAREQGDVLIVGMNSDASVKRKKGAARPIHYAADRASILSVLECVDYVAIFDADTPAELLAAIKPDVYVLGEEYRGKAPGSEHAKRLHYVARDGNSTTRLVEALRAG